MDTKVTFIFDYRNIEIPRQLLEMEMPDLDAFVDEQCEILAAKHSRIELAEGQRHVLTDEMVKAEDLPAIETVDAYREALKNDLPLTILSEQTRMILMSYLLPQLVQRSTFEINDEEATEEGKKHLAAFEKGAETKGLTFLEAGRERFGPHLDEGEIRQYLLYLGRTNFLFRVLAGEYMRRQGRTFDLASYAGYVHDLAQMSDTTEEKVRELVPLNLYIDEAPGLMMLDEMSAWLATQITFKGDAADEEGVGDTGG